MNILVMDAQGGGIGKQVVTAVRTRFPDVTITAVGTNAAATTAMLRAGADEGATGENAAVVCCRKNFALLPLLIRTRTIAETFRISITSRTITFSIPGRSCWRSQGLPILRSLRHKTVCIMSRP